ncbi:MAG: lipopolysaccharide biosynthesis regulator YciM, partial [bacterium]
MSIPDLLWLLLPIAAAAGWIAAKRSDARKTRAFWDYTSEFHQGLNVLLSDKQATPVDLFHNATSADRNTAETHIALGNHYRQRGDMERAVFMHQSVLDNEELDEEVRAAARFELARDYDSAGLLDRSEAEFKELIKSEHRISDAYQSLLQLHERESDWDQAIKVALDAERNTESHVGRKIAHYYCELASESIKQGASEMASTQLAKALEHDVTCARASMMLAELALEAKHFSQASTLYERVEALRPELMPEIIDRRFDVLRQAGDDAEFDRFLR